MNKNRLLKFQEYSDSDLILECLKGKELCLEVLYKRYFSFAMSVCIRYSRNREEAMEIVNDSYMKALEHLHEFDPAKSFRAWYGKILVNTSIDNYRRSLKHNVIVSVENIPDIEDKEPDIDLKLTADDILKIFGQIPENYKLVFNLYEIEGYSHEEIAQMIGIRTSSSRSILARAKKMLRQVYIKEFNCSKRRNETV